MTTNNLWFIAVYFYKYANPEEFPLDSLTEGLVLIEKKENHQTFAGGNYKLEWLTYNDTVVLQFYLEKNGTLSSKDWCEKYKEFFNQKIQDLTIDADNFLGSSIIYWRLVDSPNQQYGTSRVPPTRTKFGNIWKDRESIEDRKIEYTLITPQSSEERTKKIFFFAEDRGLIKIESHFHKASTEIREYDSIREELMESRRELDKDMVTLLKTLHKQCVQDQKEKLSAVTPKYMTFVVKVSMATKLQNSLQLSIKNYRNRLEILKRTDDHIYSIHIKRFKRSLNQINHDLNYCQSTMSSVHTSLDLLRGANSIATQSSGVAIQAAMAVLEIVFISYYSLGIWHFIVNEEIWDRIASFDKVMVGLGLAFLLTCGSHFFFVSKKRKICMGCVAAAVLILIYAFCVTYRINIF